MKKRSPVYRLVALCALALAPACSNSGDGKVNIGDTQIVGGQLSDYAATWNGYAEAFNFWPDGSDQVRLTIDDSGVGTLEIGDAALLAPPTDPNVGYPPGAFTGQPGQTGTGSLTSLTEGFLYPIHSASVATDRIQLGIDPNDLYSAWCPLQTPYPIQGSTGHYTCVDIPTGSSITTPDSSDACTIVAPDGTTQTVDCVKMDLCWPGLGTNLPATNGMPCTCSDIACAAATVPANTPADQYPIELDGALDATGTVLTGTLTVGDRVTVHLTKQ